ncbi:MAG: hypothetical protein WCK39_03065 [Methanomassiliicoccales archaeon]
MINDEIHEAAKTIGTMTEEEMKTYLDQRLKQSGGPTMVLSATLCMLNFSGEIVRSLDIKHVCQDLARNDNHEYLATATAMVCVLLDAHEKKLATDSEYAKMNDFTKKMLGEQLSNTVLTPEITRGRRDPMYG